jgi:hypothetical protein
MGENKKLEVALDLGFMKNRLLMNVSWYQNRSNNQLVGYPMSPSTGFSTIQYYNLEAVVENTGLELEINTTNIKSKSFTWRTGF